MNEQTREAWWVLRAQGGDRAALDALLAALQEPLFGFVASITGDRTLAEDVLQDVFVRVYTQLGWLRDPRLFRPWAYRIAAREAVRQARLQRQVDARFDADTALDEVPAPEPETADPWLRERLPALLDALSPASRAVLTLHYLQDFSLSETAELLGIPPGTVRSRLAYGLRALRLALSLSPAGGSAAQQEQP
jgi:RNA polymerase sigma-70 factor (ECF subfamily)